MRIVRFRSGGDTQVGVLRGDDVIPVEGFGISTVSNLIAMGRESVDRIAACVADADPVMAQADVHLLAPVERPVSIWAAV